MKVLIVIVTMIVLCNRAVAATGSWTGINLYNGDRVSYFDEEMGKWVDIPNTRFYGLYSSIHGESGKSTWILSHMYGHTKDDKLYLKHEDFSGESMEPTFNWWAIVNYGEVVGNETFNSLQRIEDFCGDEFCTGGTVVDNPTDFYMAFKASEVVLVSGVGYEEGESWYGWVHVSVDDELNMTLLGEGINLYGGPVVVGAVPEPSAGLLLLFGLAGLALSRRSRRRRFCYNTFQQ